MNTSTYIVNNTTEVNLTTVMDVDRTLYRTLAQVSPSVCCWCWRRSCRESSSSASPPWSGPWWRSSSVWTLSVSARSVHTNKLKVRVSKNELEKIFRKYYVVLDLFCSFSAYKTFNNLNYFFNFSFFQFDDLPKSNKSQNHFSWTFFHWLLICPLIEVINYWRLYYQCTVAQHGRSKVQP